LKPKAATWAFVFVVCAICARVGLFNAKRAWAQYPSLNARKASRTPAVRKIDSSLIQALRQQGASMPPRDSQEVRPSPAASAGIVPVDIDAEVTDRMLARIGAIGGFVISSFPRYHAIRAAIPLARLLELASMPEVRFIKPAERSTTNQILPR
jgi:hypothetical protein